MNMFKDLNLEGDSPNSSIHLCNDDIDVFNNDTTLKRQTRSMTLKSLSHESESVHSLPPFLHPSAEESVIMVSESGIHRTTDLVRQPSRWGADPSRVVGSNTRGSKATLKTPSIVQFLSSAHFVVQYGRRWFERTQ